MYTVCITAENLAEITRATERGGGATGAFCPGPHFAYGPQKDQYTLIEQSNTLQSNTLLKQSQHIFALGPSISLSCPGNYFYPISVNWTHGLDSQAGLAMFKLLNTL